MNECWWTRSKSSLLERPISLSHPCWTGHSLPCVVSRTQDETQLEETVTCQGRRVTKAAGIFHSVSFEFPKVPLEGLLIMPGQTWGLWAHTRTSLNKKWIKLRLSFLYPQREHIYIGMLNIHLWSFQHYFLLKCKQRLLFHVLAT